VFRLSFFFPLPSFPPLSPSLSLFLTLLKGRICCGKERRVEAGVAGFFPPLSFLFFFLFSFHHSRDGVSKEEKWDDEKSGVWDDSYFPSFPSSPGFFLLLRFERVKEDHAV